MVIPLAFEWRHLLFANWPVDAETIAERVPDALSVEEYDGVGWLSIVSLLNVDVRPRGVPSWAGVSAPQVNLRTYVRRGGDGTSGDAASGVYFFSLDASSLASVVGARLAHHLPYHYARVRFRTADDRVDISSRRRHPGARPARYSATYWPAGERFTPESGSLASFLTERRRTFVQAADESLRVTEIEHDPWQLSPAEASVAAHSLFEANAFERPTASPTLYYSSGVKGVASRSRPLESDHGRR